MTKRSYNSSTARVVVVAVMYSSIDPRTKTHTILEGRRFLLWRHLQTPVSIRYYILVRFGWQLPTEPSSLSFFSVFQRVSGEFLFGLLLIADLFRIVTVYCILTVSQSYANQWCRMIVSYVYHHGVVCITWAFRHAPASSRSIRISIIYGLSMYLGMMPPPLLRATCTTA